MTELSHAEARERLADLAAEPAGFDGLADRDAALAAHLAACDACSSEVDSWARTRHRLATALGADPEAVALADLGGHPVTAAPLGLRDAVLAAIRAEGPAGPSASSAARIGRVRLPLGARLRRPAAAVIAILVVGSGILALQVDRLGRAEREAAALSNVATAMERVLRDPDYRVADLRSADGAIGGSVSWSRHDLVVLAPALREPADGGVYWCWIERHGERSTVGRMWFAGGIAYWTGSLGDWATTSFDAGGTFGVSLGSGSGSGSGSGAGPAVLAAELGG